MRWLCFAVLMATTTAYAGAPWKIELPRGWTEVPQTGTKTIDVAEYHEADEASTLHLGRMREPFTGSPGSKIDGMLDLLRSQQLGKYKLVSNTQRTIGDQVVLDMEFSEGTLRHHFRALAVGTDGFVELVLGRCDGDETVLGPCDTSLATLALALDPKTVVPLRATEPLDAKRGVPLWVEIGGGVLVLAIAWFVVQRRRAPRAPRV